MVDIHRYKAMIFDWDGTLVDTCGLILDAHNHVRVYYGEEKWTMEDFLGRASKSAREYYPEIYGDKAAEAQRVLYDYVRKHHLNTLQPIEGSLDILSVTDLPYGVVSNKGHETLLIEINHVGWSDRFSHVIGAGHAEKDKPSEIPLLDCIRQMDPELAISDILYVGDTETDLLTAQNAKCDIAFIQSDKPRPDLIEKYNPTYAFHSLSDMVEAINLAVTKHAELPNRSAV
jgi:phosphoglycolate phosphatase